MQLLDSLDALRSSIHHIKASSQSIGFVPTMGNLHQGHLALIKKARQNCDRVIVSIFVNPKQFGENEDLDGYPRTLETDSDLIAPYTDLLFIPDAKSIYRNGECATKIDIPPFTSDLCGESRPVHFMGVLTVVNLLFQLVQPDKAFFGKKDFQQLWLIQRMVADLHIPVQIIGVETGRDADGLALSSRNGYLTSQQREQASTLYRTLQWIKQCIADGQSDHNQLCTQAKHTLENAGFTPDYIDIRDANTLQPPDATTGELVVLAAAWLGKARLIDNITCTLLENTQ